ncbi:alginate lyase family protein [Aliiroseovarius sp. YM-037]|uniref:alginate lyase family protein n=1 Tax=Aliiroseovarius sp. YM-037 TaxID=3341728 RepID=UPI003A80BD95
MKPRTLRPIAIWSAAILFLYCSPSAVHAEDRCAPETPPIISLSYVSRYSDDDGSSSVLDPLREAEAEAALAPLDQFIVDLAVLTDRLYTGTVSDREATSTCILEQLAHWASADALSDLGTETVELTIGARLAAFGMILWQTSPYAPADPNRDVILDWLGRRMDAQMAFWETAHEGAQTGNLRAWAGLAAAAYSLQADSPEKRDWAVKSVEAVLCTASPDGSLPQEMSRGKYALHYQLHAIAPLVSATLLLERQRVPISDSCNGALHRVVDFAVSDLSDGKQTQAITGTEQNLFDGTDTLMNFQLAWIEPYLLLRSSEALEDLATNFRPLTYSKLGGNQTELWQR